MGLRDLFFTITAKDETAAAFAAVRGNLQGVEKAARTTSERLAAIGKGMQSFGVKASVASAGLVATFRGSLSLWDTQAKAMAKVTQGIEATGGAAGRSADELFRMASELQAATRFGDESILDGVTAQLLTFTNVAGEEFDRAQRAILDVATVLNADLKGTALQVGKALNDPVAGLSALSRSGIQFTEDQKGVIKALVEMGDVAGAQRVILAELERQYGGQAAAAARVGLGALDQLSNAWGDVKEEVGRILSDMLPPIVSALTAFVGWLQALPEPVKRFAVGGGLLFAALGPVVGVLGLLVAGLAAVSGPVLAAGAGLAALTAAVVALWPEIEALAGVIRAAFASAVTWVSEAVDKIVDNLTGRLGRAFESVKSAVRSVSGSFFKLYDEVVGNSYVPDLVEEIGEWFGPRLDANMVDAADSATSTVVGMFEGMADAVGRAIGDMVRDGKFKLSTLRDALLNAGGSVLSSAISGVTGKLGDSLGGFLGSALSGLLPSFATGADFIAGGRAGTDRNVAAFNVSRGERVTVTPAGGAPAPAQVVVHITTPNPSAFSASRGQVAAEIARAVARGQRNL